MDEDQTPAELARELARQVNLMDRDERRELLKALVRELDGTSYRQLETAMDVVI